MTWGMGFQSWCAYRQPISADLVMKSLLEALNPTVGFTPVVVWLIYMTLLLLLIMRSQKTLIVLLRIHFPFFRSCAGSGSGQNAFCIITGSPIQITFLMRRHAADSKSKIDSVSKLPNM